MKWISVEDQLPGIDEPVLMLDASGWIDMYNRIKTGRRLNLNTVGDWSWYAYSHNTVENISHWMPLPKNPCA